MICPECNGSKTIALPYIEGIAANNIICPTCEGMGNLPDRNEFPNNCPACGEPVAAGEKWCEFHKAAAELEKAGKDKDKS